jgi:hypothetical protein
MSSAYATALSLSLQYFCGFGEQIQLQFPAR